MSDDEGIVDAVPAKQEVNARLLVQVIQASHLKQGSRGPRNVYVIVAVGAIKKKSAVVVCPMGQPVNPEWNFSVYITVTDPLAKFQLLVYSREGEHSETVRGWYNLRPRETDDPSAITGDIEVALKYNYDDTWAPIYQGCFSFDQGDVGVALRHFNAALAAHPELSLLLGFRSACFVALQKYAPALADAEELIALEPNSPEGHLRKGNVLGAMENFEGAEACFLVGLKLDPRHEMLVKAISGLVDLQQIAKLKRKLKYARQCFEENNMTAAISAFSECIASNPHNVSYLIYRSLSHMSLGDYGAALADARAIPKLESSWPRDGAFHTGVLMKQGHKNVTSWKRRFFVLKERFLFYYRSKDDPLPVDVILLGTFGTAFKPRNPMRFDISADKRVYRFKSATAAEARSWLDMLDAMKTQPISLSHEQGENVFFSQSRRKSVVNASQLTPQKRSSVVLDDSVIFSGYLNKAGRFKKATRLRWFALKEDNLYYFPKQAFDKAAFYGAIPLDHHTIVSEFGALGIQIVTSEGRVWKLEAESAEDAEEWLQVLGEQTRGTALLLEESRPSDFMLGAEPAPSGLSDEESNMLELPEQHADGMSISSSTPVAFSPGGAMGSFTELLNLKQSSPMVREKAPRKKAKAATVSPSMEDRSASSSEARYFQRFGLDINDYSDEEAPSGEEEDDESIALLLGEEITVEVRDQDASSCCCVIH